MTTIRPPRTGDSTLSVTKAARLLGVHPNTVRSWSDKGRLRYLRINERGDRRYRVADLQRFLASAEADAPAGFHEPGLPPGRVARRIADHAAAGARLAQARAASEGLDLVAQLVEVAAAPGDLDSALLETCRRIRSTAGAALVGIWERRPGGLVARAIDSERGSPPVIRTVPAGRGVIAVALESHEPAHARPGDEGTRPILGLGTDELAVAIPGGDWPWGVLLVAGAVELGPDGGRRLVKAIARTLSVIVHEHGAAEQASARLRRSEALRRVSTDLASRLDVSDVARDLADHARILFGADRVAVVLGDARGPVTDPVGTGFSDAYMDRLRDGERRRLETPETGSRRPTIVVGPGAVRAGASTRAAAIQEGIETLLIAPLYEGHELLGVIHVAHDRAFHWRDLDLEAAETLAGDAAVAVRSARMFGRMATWANQLESIQALGGRLSGLTTVAEIGNAIATEISEVIDLHNVRVYRVAGDQLLPVAMRGHGGLYPEETLDQLRIRVGEGITGWVAAHKVPQIVGDTASDSRAITIPGTEDDEDESMLLAPMLQEDTCLGVVALSKLGLRQFSEDDLRLLVIYAAFAAQAMANADATERLRAQSRALEQQLRAQRGLLQITDSILTTLDPSAVLEQITDRLESLIDCDNIAIEVVQRPTGLLVPLTARGVHAAEYLEPWEPGESGIATWVVDHNEPVLIDDEAKDDRVNHFRSLGRIEGSLIVVPLTGQHGAAGVLTLERLGTERRFDEQEFELVKLFAAHVSIALRNAEVFTATERRARTDDLTRLLNHGAFKDWLGRRVAAGDPFSVVMIDLDRFKDVNDSFGHQAGNVLLRQIADSIVGAVRDIDAVFRYGGDEFVLILPRTEGPDVIQVAERVQAAIRAVGAPATRWGAEGIPIAASLGVASFPTDGATADDVLLAADRACFVAKRTGRGRLATAEEGLALAAEFTLSEPTPVDSPVPASA